MLGLTGSSSRNLLRNSSNATFRNSIGGAVNVISRRPDDHYTGEFRASYNNYEGEKFEARISGPITDDIRASFMLQQFDQQGGYYHDGRYATLLAVVQHYNAAFNLRMTDGEMSDLVEYLKSL